MKLVTVLMLTALPLCCYAGSGCDILDSLISKILDPDVSESEYIEAIKEFIPDESSEMGIRKLKSLMLHQNKDTLEKLRDMQNAIYTGSLCASY